MGMDEIDHSSCSAADNNEENSGSDLEKVGDDDVSHSYIFRNYIISHIYNNNEMI
jgi:hypothetical protein